MFDQWAPGAPPARAGLGAAGRLTAAAASARRLGRNLGQALARAEPSHDWWAHGGSALTAALVVWSAVITPVKARPDRFEAVVRTLRLSDGDLSERGLDAFALRMDPAAAALARRFAPAPAATPFTPPAFGRTLPDPIAPTAPVGAMDPDAARLLNAAIPVADLPNPAARPFFLKAADLLDETRAEDCLTAAVYYEAGSESREGQQAVAQVVLNRMRHPAYPKTVCGVVFQGSNRNTGCQFTFTCDGSLTHRPTEAGWRRAREIAVAALHGYVSKAVGNATHYHADYVAPYWSTSLVKVATIGAHVFYRWTGGAGLPRSFAGLYAGNEPEVIRIAEAAAARPSLDGVVDGALGAAEPPAPVSFAPPAEPAPAPVAAGPVPVATEAPGRAAPPEPKPPETETRRKTNWQRLPTRTDW